VNYSGICGLCTHFNYDPEVGKPACAAFPQGIPVEILTGQVDHRQPYDGDNNIQFAPDRPVSVDRIESKLRSGQAGVTDE
jgi:hypothetical protein